MDNNSGRAVSEKGALLPVTEMSDTGRSSSKCTRRRLLSTVLLMSSIVAYAVFVSFGAGSWSWSRVLSACHRGSNHVNTDDSHMEVADNLCLTPDCVHAASEILYNLSPNYKNMAPCEDFEEMVCGGWRDRHDLRSDQGDVFEGNLMIEASETMLRHILEAEYPGSSIHSHFSPARLESSTQEVDKQNFEKLQDAYNACLNEDAIKQVGIEPLMQILNHLSKHKELPDAMLYLAELGVSALLEAGSGADARDPDTAVVYISSPDPVGLPAKEYYTDKDQLKQYTDVISKVFAALESASAGMEIKSSSAQQVVEFEKELAAATPDEADLSDITQTYNPMSLAGAKELTPQVHLSQLLKALAPADVSIDRIIVATPQYLKDLATILANTPETTIQAYLQWKVIQSFANHIEAEALRPLQEFTKILGGQDPKSTTERWRTCLQHIDGGLGWFLSRFYIEKAFSAEAKRIGNEIISDIRHQFAATLETIEWMEDEVKDLAIQKVRNIVQKVGYPTESPDITDPIDLHNYYESVNITSSDYFANVVSLRHFEVQSDWSQLGKPIDRSEWGMTADTVNAYYNPSGNEIVFPAGIMQFPVFTAGMPQYLSYGAFGSVAGHELSHAFDNSGRHYDQNGNYTDWWTDNTVKEFDSRAQCFISEYSEFTVEGPTPGSRVHVNGKLTQGENIADAGGLSASFAAWETRSAASPAEANLDLPGLDFFTHEQLFFVNYANWWCGKSTKQAALQRIYVDPHAPKWARVLGAMQNSRDFKRVFNCPIKEPTCELW